MNRPNSYRVSFDFYFCFIHSIRAKADRKRYYSISESDRLIPSDINTGSIMVTNLGSTYRGISGAVSLIEIIPPNTFAIGLNAVRKEPVVNSKDGIDSIKIISVFPIVYSFDHRCFDFGHVIPFMREINRILTNPLEFFNSQFKDFQDLMKFNNTYQEILLSCNNSQNILEYN